MAARALAPSLVLAAALASGCGAGATSGTSRDLAAPTLTDMSIPIDVARCGGFFTGFSQTAPLTFFQCSCGCSVDTFMHPDVIAYWGLARTGANLPVGTADGLQIILQSSAAEPVSAVGILSQSSTGSGFYLDGDFDLLVDYALGMTPPGESHLILGVRIPASNVGTDIYDVERARLADGSDVYRSQLGGVPPHDTATDATQGTLELSRRGLTYAAYADGKMIGSFLAQSGPRMEITLTAALSGCAEPDAGTCSYTPSWISLRLANGVIVNMP
jgi:hypothetical protein